MLSLILSALVSTAPLKEIRDSQHVVTNVNLTEIQKGFEEIPKQYRKLGDDQAYAVKSVGEFVSWSCPGRPELVQAMQGRQPEYYDYGDGMGEYYINLEVNGRYWYGWAYADPNADTVVFSVYCDYWDEETGEYYYDWAEITGKRGVAEYDLENPIDRFATKGEVSESVGSIRDGVNHLTGLLTSETKLWRTGKPNECGHGWGYMHHNLTNDLRKWRIRVPSIETYTDHGVSNTQDGTFAPWQVPKYRATNLYHCPQSGNSNRPYTYMDVLLIPRRISYMLYPETHLSGWQWKVSLSSTRGVYGNDAVTHADYLVKNPCLLGAVWNANQVGPSVGEIGAPVYRVTAHCSVPDFAKEEMIVEDSETHKRYLCFTFPSDQKRIRNSKCTYYYYGIEPPTSGGDFTVSTSPGSSTYYIYAKNGTSYQQVVFRGITITEMEPESIKFPLDEVYESESHFELSYNVQARFRASFELQELWVSSAYNITTSAHSTNAVYTYTSDWTSYEMPARKVTYQVATPAANKFSDMYSQAYRLMGTYDSNLFYDAALDCTFRIVSSNGCFYTEVHHAGDWREKAWR